LRVSFAGRRGGDRGADNSAQHQRASGQRRLGARNSANKSDPHPIRDFSLSTVGYAVRHNMMPSHPEVPGKSAHTPTAVVDVAVALTGMTPGTGASCAA
jgi:hypothetical protein